MEGVRLILSGDKRTVLESALATVHMEPGNQHLANLSREELLEHSTVLRHKRRVFEELRRYKLRRGTVWSIWAYNAYLKDRNAQQPYRDQEKQNWRDEFSMIVRKHIRWRESQGMPSKDLKWALSKIKLSTPDQRT